jgi:ribosomal protein S17
MGGSRKDEKGNKVDQEVKKMEVGWVQTSKGFEKEGEVVQLPHNSKLRPQEDDKVFIEDTRKINKNKERSVVIENKGKEKMNTPMKSQG